MCERNASEIKISIVMPILNTVEYIRECMESLVNQTLKDIEILCVDADSTDGTREILQEYAESDERVRILTDTKGSAGYANNLGMSMARGKYVAIVEPDDFVACDMYEQLYNIAEKYGADVVRADYKVFFGDADNREYVDKAVAGAEQYGKILNPSAEQELFKNDMSTWAGIYNRKFIEKNGIRHNETRGAAYQDNGFWFLVMAHAEKLYYSPVSGYRYRMDNPNSSVHNRKKVFAICDEYDFIRKSLRGKGMFEEFRQTYIWAKFIRYMSSYHRLDDTLKPLFADRFSEEMKEHMEEKGDREFLDECFTGGQKKLIRMLLQGGEVFNDYVMSEKDRLLKLLDSNNSLVQFGCGSDGFRVLNNIRGCGCLDRISCLCDNNPKLWGMEFFGKKICSVDEAELKYNDACYIIASTNYSDEISQQLVRRGVKRERIMAVISI